MSIKAVCFDLGGVLVRICSTWSDAMAAAEVEGRVEGGPRFTDHSFFVRYQAGVASEDEYLAELGRTLGGLTVAQARSVHNHILLGPYPETDDVAGGLAARGVTTGCLSNTNAIHWQEMTQTDRFPVVAALPTKVASHLARVSKPDRAAFRAFEESIALPPQEILLFDDTLENVQAAARAGWEAALVDPAGDTASQMRAILKTFGLL